MGFLAEAGWCLTSIWLYVAGVLFTVSLVTYLLPFVAAAVLPVRDLKKAYKAEWAIVTGGSSGIGLSLCNKLAAQGLNVVVAALDNDLLPKALKQLKADFPNQEFISVPVDLSKDGYVDQIKEATKGLTIQVAFLNAGYIATGFFDMSSIGAQLANYNCNATSAMTLAHYFVQHMKAANKPGLIMFTSSPASLLPSPSCAMYGSTKAFLTEFAMSLAPEVAAMGIDVSVMNPSPVATNFYNGAHEIDMLKFFKSTATTPDHIADAMLKGAGRLVVVDQGYYSAAARIILKIADINFIAQITKMTSPTMPDFVKLRATQEEQARKNAKK